MIRSLFVLCTVFLGISAAAAGQTVAIGIAPVYDGGGDEFGPAVVEHLTLFAFEDLLKTKQFVPSMLNPGAVYTPLDTSWLSEYAQDRPDLDLLLVGTLKPMISPDKSSWTIQVEFSLLDARTGQSKSTWTVSENIKSKNAWLDKGQALVTNAINIKSGHYGYAIMPSRDFEKQPIGKVTAHLAEQLRDTLPAHMGGFTRTDAVKPAAVAGAPCEMHTRITYSYKHSASHSYTLLVNGLDQTTTIKDGVSSFTAPEGPIILQFTIEDAPYKLARQSIYQLSAVHSCSAKTLVIDVGAGGDAHHRWE